MQRDSKALVSSLDEVRVSSVVVLELMPDLHYDL